MRNFFITLIFLAVSIAAAAQASITISGKVTDENNEALEFVSVKIAGKMLGTTTGLDGKYRLVVPRTDTIRVVYSCIGYEDSHRKLVNAKGAMSINVKMSPASYTLGDLIVTDYQKQLGTVQKIERKDFKMAPDVSGGSVESLITTLGGATSNNELSSQYSVRGGSYDENSVYINGIEIYRPQLISNGQQEGLSVINPDMVGSIGFSAGGFSAQYSDKMSSVLDITYREPEAFEGAASVSLMGGSASVGTNSKRFTQLHGIRYKQNQLLLGSLDEQGEYDPRFFDYQTSITYRPASKWKVGLLGNISVNKYSFIPATRTTKFGTFNDAKSFTVYFNGAEHDQFETYFGALSTSYKPNRSSEFTLQASSYFTNEIVGYDISGEYWLNQTGTNGSSGTVIDGGTGVGRYHEHARNRFKAAVYTLSLRGATGINNHNLDYGISASRENTYDRSREWELRDSAGFSLPLDPDALRMVYNYSAERDRNSNRYAAYAMDTYRINSSLGYFNVNAGVRLSYWDFNRELLFSPRANVGFVPESAPAVSLRLATGVYYQSPFHKEMLIRTYDPAGNCTAVVNPNIKSQRSIPLILGGDYTFRAFNRPFKLTAEAYYKVLSNLISYERDNLKLIYSGVNDTHGYACGIDFKLFGQFVPGTDSWLSFSLMNTKEKLNGVWVPRPTDQRYSAALYFTDFFPLWPRLKFNLRGVLSDGLPVTPPRGSRDKSYFRTPAYKRLDAGFAYSILPQLKDGEQHTGWARYVKNIWLGLDVFNMLDISNVSSYYWVTDVNNLQYAVPNYLTRRQLNVRLSVEF